MASRKSTRSHPFEKTVGDCLEAPFPHILVHTLMEASLRDKVMSTYLGGLITVIIDVGGSTVFGSTAH